MQRDEARLEYIIDCGVTVVVQKVKPDEFRVERTLHSHKHSLNIYHDYASIHHWFIEFSTANPLP